MRALSFSVQNIWGACRAGRAIAIHSIAGERTDDGAGVAIGRFCALYVPSEQRRAGAFGRERTAGRPYHEQSARQYQQWSRTPTVPRAELVVDQDATRIAPSVQT